jgi:hypothetical protein
VMIIRHRNRHHGYYGHYDRQHRMP